MVALALMVVVVPVVVVRTAVVVWFPAAVAVALAVMDRPAARVSMMGAAVQRTKMAPERGKLAKEESNDHAARPNRRSCDGVARPTCLLGRPAFDGVVPPTRLGRPSDDCVVRPTRPGRPACPASSAMTSPKEQNPCPSLHCAKKQKKASPWQQK